jgi:tetratricopeptide (TPR) repeat protein
MMRRALLGGLLICLSGSLLLAKPGVVRTKDGRNIEGDITDKGIEGATIVTKAGSVTIRVEDVAAIEYASDIKELYKQRLAKLPKDAGAQSHFELARWLYDYKEYDLVQKELDTALAIDPNHAASFILKHTVERTIMMERNRDGTGTRPPGPATRPAAPSRRDRRYVDAEQISIIRQSEIKDTDRPVRVRLDGDIKKRFVEYSNMDARDFAALSDYDKALAILKKGTPEMRKDVKILSDPAAIAEYKTKVQPVLLSGCASTACHGGVNAGSFVLYSPADSDAVTYTNFYFLTQYTANVDSAKRKAIDRLYPANSLITQFGLPRDKSEFDHPEARGWTHVFKTEQDPRYVQILNWIGSGLIAIEPKYPEGFFPLPSQPAVAPDEKKAVEKDQPKPAPPPAASERQKESRNSAKENPADSVDEARQRIRVINPGAITIPPIPF